MSVEFVDPDGRASAPAGTPALASVTGGAPGSPARAAHRPPRVSRFPALVWLAGAVPLAIAPFLSSYERRQTAFTQDFDGVHPVVTSQVFNGFGQQTSTVEGPLSAFASVSHGAPHGIVWLVAAAGLLCVAVLTVARPSRLSTALAAVFGAAAGGAVTTTWLSLRQLEFAIANLRADVTPGVGFWVAVSGAGVTLVGALAVGTGPLLMARITAARARRRLRPGRTAGRVELAEP